MGKKVLYGLLIITLIVLPVLSACNSSSTNTSAKTLKLGAVVWLGWPLGLDMKRGVEVMIDMENKAGGIDIGGEKYKIELISYDSNNDQTTTQSFINKLIYEDKVNFIITDSMYIGSVVQETEKNKVICVAGTPVPAIFDKNYQYSFEAGFMTFATPEVAGWLAKNMNFKTVECAFPDDQGGHAYGGGVVATLESYGIKVTSIFYPPTSTDLSAVGTKVKTDNPDGFIAAGSSGSDALVYQAVVKAGYKGQLFSTTTITLETLKTTVPIASLEGFVGGAWPVEFDPASTQMAKDFKAAYIAKFNKWDGPEIQLTGAWSALKTALEQAGTTDTTKIAQVLANGLKYEGPTGKAQMVPRNDLGITKTVDSVSEFCIKKVVNGKPVLLHTITVDEGIGYLPKGIIPK
jgi:branched-chain amino acid transport system substrate-binding protein